jgi:hypothetical protein
MVLCEHGLPATHVDPYLMVVLCANQVNRRRVVYPVDELVTVEEAKRYDYSVDLFCRVPDCLNAPGPDGLCTQHARLNVADLPPLLTWIDPDTASRVPIDAPFAAATTQFTGFVSHFSLHLTDGRPPKALWPSFKPGGVGLISARPGMAALVTGTHTGFIPFTVTIANRDPGADLHGYEDVVESDFYIRVPELMILAGNLDQSPLPPAPAGPGAYRVRYHGNDMDAAAANTATDERYLVQVWPTRPSPPVVVKETSSFAAQWR